ncbi:MAG TPA: hypothetical protein VFN25_10680 [Dokdonella sp.]|uniref:hypothetical protein n=1 Tax=Dokdonella sp. TaxID=2291710 RepID=UPI002D7E6480|nr:hypothetical protein [Dokdonella sp.]HET9033357.1 hypothetical protein [Dokdonella sp.]
MPGTHWMTIGVLTDWLREHHPEIQGGIIALSAQDLAWPSNGYYELGIVQPFRQASEDNWIAQHNPFDASKIESYGSRFALFAWRDDIRDFLTHPFSRINRYRKSSRVADTSRLFSNPEMPGDMCAWGLESLDACDKLDANRDAPENLKRQCQQVMETVDGRPDFAALSHQSPLPESMQKTRQLIQQQLRAITWSKPPIVLLMPTPPIWRNDTHGAGLQQWALQILKPLEEEGSIHLIDATAFFDSDAKAGCAYFGDFYHQNARGRAAFSDWLLPKVEALLYPFAVSP